MPAGYSGTPLPKKLGLKETGTLLLINAPAGVESQLVPLPPGARILSGNRLEGPFDVILLFVGNRAAREKQFVPAAAKLTQSGGLWIGWPKKASGVTTDLTENPILDFGLGTGLVDNKVCAVNDTWSGLRFVIRVKDRR